jgi:hypothetical protein
MVGAGTVGHPKPPPARVQLIPASPSPTTNILDFRHTAQLMAESYRLTRRWLTDAQSEATYAA